MEQGDYDSLASLALFHFDLKFEVLQSVLRLCNFDVELSAQYITDTYSISFDKDNHRFDRISPNPLLNEFPSIHLITLNFLYEQCRFDVDLARTILEKKIDLLQAKHSDNSPLTFKLLDLVILYPHLNEECLINAYNTHMRNYDGIIARINEGVICTNITDIRFIKRDCNPLYAFFPKVLPLALDYVYSLYKYDEEFCIEMIKNITLKSVHYLSQSSTFTEVESKKTQKQNKKLENYKNQNKTTKNEKTKSKFPQTSKLNKNTKVRSKTSSKMILSKDPSILVEFVDTPILEQTLDIKEAGRYVSIYLINIFHSSSLSSQDYCRLIERFCGVPSHGVVHAVFDSIDGLEIITHLHYLDIIRSKINSFPLSTMNSPQIINNMAIILALKEDPMYLNDTLFNWRELTIQSMVNYCKINPQATLEDIANKPLSQFIINRLVKLSDSNKLLLPVSLKKTAQEKKQWIYEFETAKASIMKLLIPLVKERFLSLQEANQNKKINGDLDIIRGLLKLKYNNNITSTNSNTQKPLMTPKKDNSTKLLNVIQNGIQPNENSSDFHPSAFDSDDISLPDHGHAESVLPEMPHQLDPSEWPSNISQNPTITINHIINTVCGFSMVPIGASLNDYVAKIGYWACTRLNWIRFIQ